MVREDSWREVHRLFHVERCSKSEIAQRLALDRKTVRAILRAATWRPYLRAERADGLLAAHAAHLQARAPHVRYSARILFQELRQQRRYPRQLRDGEALRAAAARGRGRPRSGRRCASRRRRAAKARLTGGRRRSHFRHRPVILHVFVLTLGYSRRSFYEPCLGETLSQFLDAHERAFEYFGGPYARASLRSAADGLPARRGRAGRVERDLQAVRRLLGLRAASLPGLPRPDEGQGRVGREILQGKFSPRAGRSSMSRISARNSRSGTSRSPTCAFTAPRTSGPARASSASARI